MAAESATVVPNGTAGLGGNAGRIVPARTIQTIEPDSVGALDTGLELLAGKGAARASGRGSSNTAVRTTGSMSDVIAWLLVCGVAASAAVLVAGLLLLAITGQTGYGGPLSARLLLAPQGTVALPSTIGDVLRGALQLRPFAVIELGALLLIATPIFRVAASVLLFLAERDRLYAGITLAVLALLLASVFWLGLAA